MNRLLLILALVVAFPFIGNAQRKRAFMVGISKYHTNGYKVWNNIHGAEDVAILKPELAVMWFALRSVGIVLVPHEALLVCTTSVSSAS